MNTKKCFATSFAVVFLTGIVFLTSCKKSNVEPPVPIGKNAIAYVYNADSTDAVAFRALLQENGCQVTLIAKAKAATTDYNNYQLIVIDQNTDYVGGSLWTTADAEAIKASGKHMLLMGMGGLLFSSKLGNDANWGNSAQFNETSVSVLDKTAAFLKTPYIIDIPTSTPAVAIYPNPVMGAGQHVASAVLNNNILVGKFWTANTYYPVTFERDQYMIFGFFKGVQAMTTNGRKLIVNLCYFTGKFTL
ncbi:MAG: hypothetical protein ABIX01_02705 [Chitinophagaceae bacterium]